MLRQPDVQGWISAEEAELKNHSDNKSFTYLDRSALPNGRKLVRMTWVYKRKRSGKLKARLCVQGCSQVPGVDYNQTFCATMRSTTLRLRPFKLPCQPGPRGSGIARASGRGYLRAP